MRLIFLSYITKNPWGHPFIGQDYTTVESNEELLAFIQRTRENAENDKWRVEKMVITEIDEEELRKMLPKRLSGDT